MFCGILNPIAKGQSSYEKAIPYILDLIGQWM